mmetsp:Transcript_3660/g.7663  ORF Transcript_3660/g.7663 Transcript_3660/m.7663 type:complete len:127 (-) Transcript_3660:597-977(-)
MRLVSSQEVSRHKKQHHELPLVVDKCLLSQSNPSNRFKRPTSSRSSSLRGNRFCSPTCLPLAFASSVVFSSTPLVEFPHKNTIAVILINAFVLESDALGLFQNIIQIHVHFAFGFVRHEKDTPGQM